MTPPFATYEDVEAVPEDVRAELIDRELILQAHPAFDHQSVLFHLGGWLRATVDGRAGDGSDGPTGWLFASGPELWLGTPDPKTLVLVPDLAAWRRPRFARTPGAHGILVPPDWVCEILSRSTQRHDRLTKAAAFAGAGVDWYWLIDPIARFVEVFERRDSAWTRVAAVAAGERAVLPPFDGPEADIAEWWADLG